MIGMTISNEYTWFGRTAERLPEGVEIAMTVEEQSWLRPWTQVWPYTKRFVAVDTGTARTNENLPDQRMADLYFFGRWSPVNQAPMIFDCAAAPFRIADRRRDLCGGRYRGQCRLADHAGRRSYPRTGLRAPDMFTRLSLRFRIFLFFCLLAAGGGGAGGRIALSGLVTRRENGLPTAPFRDRLRDFRLPQYRSCCWLSGCSLTKMLPSRLTRLAADLRLRAHSGVNAAVETQAARYLGDLAPAANAVSTALSSTVIDTATQVARETERLKAETARLTALLTEIPVATILVNPGSMRSCSTTVRPPTCCPRSPLPRLKAPLTDYFDSTDLLSAQEEMIKTGAEVSFVLQDHSRKLRFDAKLKALETDGYILVINVGEGAPKSIEARPLVFDFDLLSTSEATEIHDTALRNLCFVAFDTETTGLSVEKDDVVQLGAVRVLNGRIVHGEVVDTYVNPGRPIPPASTLIHQVTDADVAGAPDFATAGRNFHHFARDAVLVAHNAPFDIGLLRRCASDMGVDWSHPVLDTVLLSAAVFGTTEDHSLDALCERLSIMIPPDLRHTAIGDAQATAQVLVKLIPLLEGKGLVRFGQVIAETQRHGRLLQDLNKRQSEKPVGGTDVGRPSQTGQS